jgi:ABC-type antimicrobial peptide transport system permease subunit
MSPAWLVVQTVRYYWRTNLAVIAGVAAAVAVLAGALLVGESVRASLRDIAIGRLGRTEQVVASTGFFREALSEEIRAGLGQTATAAPLIVATGFVTHEASGRRAAAVSVYGVDERFWTFHARAAASGVAISPALAAELQASSGDVLLLRLQKPSAIPIESLFGRKDDIARTVRLDATRVLPRQQLGTFSLRAAQSDVRAIFMPLSRLQRDLGVARGVNTVLVAGASPDSLTESLKRAAALEDLGATVAVSGAPPSLVVESRAGVLSKELESATIKAGSALGLHPLPVMTYLATTIRKGNREIPYSLVTATDLDAAGLAGSSDPRAGPGTDSRLVLNEWAARDLEAATGDDLDLEYFLWDTATGISTHTAQFRVARVVRIEGFAADRRLAPQYPGITEADSLSDWDPPFPVDFSRVRPADEAYWKQFRTTPKMFIALSRGRELWTTRYGGSTSVRFPLASGTDPDVSAQRLRDRLRSDVRPEELGLTVSSPRQEAATASTGATDFGEYFTYFSFFIVFSALLLAVLFFRLGIEGRLRQIGVLRASGFSIASVRRLLMGEALVLSIAGSVIGIAGAVGYAEMIVYGLRTWWVGAVGTTLLTVHVSWVPLAAGGAAGIVAATVCVALSLRTVGRLSPRRLLAAQTIETEGGSLSTPRRSRALATIGAAAGLAMIAAGFFYRPAQAGMFFGAGAALLIACLFGLSAWLRSRDAKALTGRGAWPLWRLGFRSAATRPSRSVLSVALIASAAFIIVSVDAFRRGEVRIGDRHSGTGGFALIAQSEVPMLSTPNDAAGRETLVVNAPDFSRIHFTRFRLRPGDDASCLNLYRPSAPTIVAPEPELVTSGRFTFASSIAEHEPERSNPWLLLTGGLPGGEIPAIADATSLQYVLHASVGDTFSMDIGRGQPLVLRFVAALSDSVLQGQIIISEENFTRLFPAVQGYRLFLIDDPAARDRASADALAATLERELAPFGFDATSTVERLASFHRVENTYLSTFQALGGLGLLLGTVGLAAIMFRNVLERRRELALLRAVGYDRRAVSIVIIGEAALLLGSGLGAGLACAALASAPAWIGRAGAGPGSGLIVLVIAIAITGLLASAVATRAALNGRILDGLRAE